MFMFFSKFYLDTHDSDWQSRSTHAVLALPGKALLTLWQQVFSGSTLFTVFLVSSVIVTKSRLCVYVLLRELHTGSEKERCLFCLLKEECLYHKLEPDFGEICMYCCWGHSLMSSASKKSLNGIMHSQNHSDAPLLIWLHAFRFVLKS